MMGKINPIYRFLVPNNIKRKDFIKKKSALFISTSVKTAVFEIHKKYYETSNKENYHSDPDHLKNVLEKVQHILKQHNFPMLLKLNGNIKNTDTSNHLTKTSGIGTEYKHGYGSNYKYESEFENRYKTTSNITNMRGTRNNPNEEIDHLKLLSVLNKIMTEIEKDDNLKVNIWNNSTFVDLMTFVKVRIPIFEFDELFLFVLCFSKIQFLPQMLLNEILNRIKEKEFLKSFYRYDKTKFFQFLLILSTLKNIKHIQNKVVHSNFMIFINNYIKIILEEMKNEEYKDSYKHHSGENTKTMEMEMEMEMQLKMEKTNINTHINKKENEKKKEKKEEEEKKEKKEKNIQKSTQLNLNHYLLLCTALYNLNIRHFDFFYEASNKILEILEKVHFYMNDNMKNNMEMDIEMEKEFIAKKIINIYLSYCSLGFDFMYFYDKLNSFLYNMVPIISSTDCVTLLLCISTLREQKNFHFPLCLMANLEKHLLNKFYSLESKDLMLLIYLFTYLKLYLSNYEKYIHMCDYLFLLRDYDMEDEENKLKLFQIYHSLIHVKSTSVESVESEKESKTSSSVSTPSVSSYTNRNEEEIRVNNIIVTKLKEKGIWNKIEQNINLSVETNEQELEQELNHSVELLKLLLEHKDMQNHFQIKEIQKNKILYNYYLNHIYVVFSTKSDSKVEYKIVFHFDTMTFDDLENPIDVYINMKKRNIENLNVKYILVKFSSWKRLTKDQQKKLVLKEMNDLFLEKMKHDKIT